MHVNSIGMHAPILDVIAHIIAAHGLFVDALRPRYRAGLADQSPLHPRRIPRVHGAGRSGYSIA